VLAAAKSPDEKKERKHLCQAHFFLGEYYVLAGLHEDALSEFYGAISMCPPVEMEFVAAKFERTRIKALIK
jgi:lipoprotein NlpI